MQRYIFILPLLLVIITRAPLVTAPFVYDDIPLVAEHPHLGEQGFIRELFSRDYGLEFSGKPAGYYRPFLMIINWSLHQLSGPSPVIYHGFSLVVFIATLILLIYAGTQLSDEFGRSIAFVAGCLYAVHPTRTETIGQFASLPDLLIELLSLLLLILLIRRWKHPNSSLSGPMAGAALVGLIAGITKESALFIVPAIAISALLIKHQGTGRRTLLPIAITALIGLCGAIGLRWWSGVQVQHHLASYARALLSDQAGTANAGIWRSLVDLLLPRPAQSRFLIEVSNSYFWVPLLLLTGCLFLAIWGFCLHAGKAAGALLTAWLGAGMLSLTLVVISHVAYSQRYLPAAPFILLLAAAATTLRRWVLPPSSLLPRAAGSAYLVFLMIFSLQGALSFRSENSFYSHQAAYAAPNDPSAYIALAITAAKQGDLQAMGQHISFAEICAPRHRDVGKIKATYARYLLDAKRPDLALEELERAITNFPDNPDLVALQAVALAQQGRLRDGADAIRQAIQMAPSNSAFRVLQKQIERDLKTQ